MSRLQARFDALRKVGRKALVPFITAGDPALDATVPIMHALVAAGADVIELGVPFSDPMADGPTIQRSSERALARGAGLAYVLDSVRAFREHDANTPVVLMGYLNPVEITGAAHFARQATQAGVDGVLLVDLPPEEAGEFRDAFAGSGPDPDRPDLAKPDLARPDLDRPDLTRLDLILLAAPTTSEARMAQLCADAQGYLYYVSFAGVTGSDQLDASAASLRLAAIGAGSTVPVVAGFGIKDAASAAAMAAQADGVVVGSALVAAMADARDPEEAAARAGAFLAPLREALDRDSRVTA